MHYEVKKLSVEGSMDYARLHVYIQEPSAQIHWKKRPLILICPGGGYQHTSDRESEPIAFQFLAMGYHVAVLRYSVLPAKYPTSILELCQSMIYLRKNADEWNIDSEKIYLAGFSAGGHLAASLGCFWKSDETLSGYFKVDAKMLQPNALILGYPVITSGEFAHRGSFDCLVGDDKKLLEKFSLENQVNEYVPKTFLWHTFEDQAVPLENTLLFAKALREKNIHFEYHVFPAGHHGLALANRLTDSEPGRDLQPECEIWVQLCKVFLENL